MTSSYKRIQCSASPSFLPERFLLFLPILPKFLCWLQIIKELMDSEPDLTEALNWRDRTFILLLLYLDFLPTSFIFLVPFVKPHTVNSLEYRPYFISFVMPCLLMLLYKYLKITTIMNNLVWCLLASILLEFLHLSVFSWVVIHKNIIVFKNTLISIEVL